MPSEPAYPLLTVMVPMWNEQENCIPTYEAVTELGRALVEKGEIGNYELLAIDDASTDETPEMLDRLADDDPHVRVVHHPENRKLGGALKTGFAEAKGDVVLYTDADLPADIFEAERGLRLLRTHGADMICTYRIDRGDEGLRRIVLSRIYNMLIRLFFGLRVRDVNFAFKLIDRAVLDAVTLKSEGSFIDAELLLRARAAGFEMLQFGVEYYPRTRGTSTLSSTAVIMTLLREMWELRKELRGTPGVS